MNEEQTKLQILTTILETYNDLPIKFCLKEFLNWEDSKIKSFVKEYKKVKKEKQKQYAKSISEFSFGKRCCENPDGCTLTANNSAE